MSCCLNKEGLSILIPLYNQVGVALAMALSKQVEQCAKEEKKKNEGKGNANDTISLGFEIIFADDGSVMLLRDNAMPSLHNCLTANTSSALRMLGAQPFATF